MYKVLDYIGYYGPEILLLLSIYSFYGKYNHLVIYLTGFAVNQVINIILKLLVKQPRPEEDKKMFNLLVHHDKRISFDKYGMPSGHSQSVWYSTTFIYLALKNNIVTSIYLLISIITMIQRVEYKAHSIPQVIVGMLIGITVGYLFYTFVHK